MGRTSVANRRRAATASVAAAESSVITLFAWTGALFLGTALWCWARWIGSDNFRAVDPGPDPLPVWQFWTLGALQVVGLFAAAYLLWRYTVKPRLTNGRFTTEGLV